MVPIEDNIVHTITFRAMNTNIEILACGQSWTMQDVELLARDWFDSVEERFSRFKDDSELSFVNRSSGRRCLVSEQMLDVLQLAERFREETDGAFYPYALQALKQAGYDESFDLVKSRGTFAVVHAEDKAPGQGRWMDIDPGMKAVLLAPRVQLDLGGIVKGWAVRRLAEWMKREGKIARGLVNAGGDLMVWGRHDGQPQPWGIAIENPWRPDEEIGLLRLACGAVATSSRLGRAWQTDQGRMHHLIDPRTMRPSRSDTVQCTVTGPDPIACDVWAKTICILGSEEGATRLKRQAPAYEAAIFTEDERVLFCGNRESLGTTWIDLPAEPEDEHHIWTERLGTAWWNGLQDCPSGK